VAAKNQNKAIFGNIGLNTGYAPASLIFA